MSEDKGYKMVSVAISNHYRHALKLLRKKYKVSRMDDVIGILLEEHEKSALNAGIRLADMEIAQEAIVADYDDEDDE